MLYLPYIRGKILVNSMLKQHNAQTSHSNAPYMRLGDVLQYMKISRTTLYRLIKAGKVPSPIKAGPRISLWRRQDIETVMKGYEEAQPHQPYNRNKTETLSSTTEILHDISGSGRK